MQGPLSSTFPIENRKTVVTMSALKNHLDRSRRLPFVKQIADFHLLLLLARYFDLNADVPVLAECVLKGTPIPEGYQLLIEFMANASWLISRKTVIWIMNASSILLGGRLISRIMQVSKLCAIFLFHIYNAQFVWGSVNTMPMFFVFKSYIWSRAMRLEKGFAPEMLVKSLFMNPKNNCIIIYVNFD